MVNLFRRGRIAEKKVADKLKKKGFKNVRRSKGSRGPADIYAMGPDNKKYYIQVKSGSARATKEEIKRLRKVAKKRRGVAVVIHKDGNSYHWKFYGDWSPRRG